MSGPPPGPPPSNQISLNEAVLVGFILESIGYGIYLILFIGCIYALAFRGRDKRHRGPPVNKIMFGATLLFGCTVTMHWSVWLSRIIQAYSNFLTVPGGPIVYLANLSNFTYVFQNTITVIEVCVADLIMVYRVYVVWGFNKYIVAVPLVLTIANSAFGFVLSNQFATLPAEPVAEQLALATVGRWIVIGLSVSVAVNLTSCLLIAVKIYSATRIHMQGTRFYGQNLMNMVVIIVESAGIYVAFTIATLILYLVGSNVQFITLLLLSPITGITFSLIIVRVALGVDRKPMTTAMGRTGVSSSTKRTIGGSNQQLEVTVLSELETGHHGKTSGFDDSTTLNTYTNAH
jgi:hypothetical protein